MEESSEKRRDRLRAMRWEASDQSQSQSQSQPQSQSQSQSSPSTSVQNLSNPLVNPSTFNERTSPVPRFDFYTDPMAAFHGLKRTRPDSFSSPIRSPSPFPDSVAGLGSSIVTATHPPPGHQFQTTPSPNQSAWRSPIQFQSPFSGQIRGTPPNPNPNYLNRSGGGLPSYGFSPNYSPQGGGHPSPNFRHGGSPSPHSNSRRGNSSWFSPRPGRSGGKGRGFHNDHGFNRHEPSHYYIKTMVKDPWRKLNPIVGNILVPRSGSGSWLPQSIAGPKRCKVAESSSTNSQLSLAESLALSLEEAVDDE